MVVKYRISILVLFVLCAYAFASRIVEDSRSRFVLEDGVSNVSVYGCIDAKGAEIPGNRFMPENSTREESSDVPVRIYRVAVPAGSSPRISLSVKKKVPLSKPYCKGANLNFLPVRASKPFFRDGLWMVDVSVPLYEKWGSSVRLRSQFKLEVDFAVSGSGTNPGKRAVSRVVNPFGAEHFGVLQKSLRKSLQRMSANDVSDVHFLAQFLVGDKNVGTHSEDGLYAVDFKSIRNALVRLQRQTDLDGIPVEKLRLYGASADTLTAMVPGADEIVPFHLVEIPIEVRDHSEGGRGRSNGVFDDGDSIVFVGYGTSVWKFSDSLYYHSVSPYSFYQYFQFGWKESGNGLRLSDEVSYSASGAKDVSLMRYLRAEKDVRLRDAYFGMDLEWDESTGKEWFWFWHNRFDSVSVPQAEFVLPHMKNLPGRIDGGDAYLQVSYVPHRSVFEKYVENSKVEDQFRDYTLSGESLPTRVSSINFRFSLNGSQYLSQDGSILADGSFLYKNPPLRDSNNDYLLVMLPNTKQYDRFDGYTVAYQWTPVVDSAEWYLPGRISGKVRLPVPDGVKLMKFNNMLPVGILASSGGYAYDSVSALDEVRYMAYRDNVFRTAISVEALPVSNSDVLQDISRINSKTEYLILTPPEFVDGAIELGRFRSSDSALVAYPTTVVNVDDVYRLYSAGVPSPVSIRNYIAYAYSVCPNLRYVLLVGWGHYDYRGFVGKLGKNFIPPFEMEDNVTEDFFAVLDSGEMIRYGLYDVDLAVGRLPVRTNEELRDYVEKAKDYESVGRFDHSEWRKTILFAADDAKNGLHQDGTLHTSSQEGVARNIDALVDTMHFRWNHKKVYLLDYEEDAAGQKKTATDDFLNIMNQGALITTYFGHGSRTDWASEGLLKPSYLSRISNKKRTTILGSFACTVSRFDQGGVRTLSEEFLLAPSVGSIVSLGAARETFADFNENFASNFLFALLRNDGLPVGDAYLRAKNSVENKYSRARYNNEHYLLLGEPVIGILGAGFKVKFDERIDTLKALDKVTLSGSVQGMEDGIIDISLHESRSNKRLYLGIPTLEEDTLDVVYDGPLVYSEKIPVVGGRFKTEFVTPRKVSFGDTATELSAWAYSSRDRAIGRYWSGGIVISGFSTYADSINDNSPPSIHIRNCDSRGAESSYADGERVRLQLPACVEVDIEDSTALDFREQADEGISFEVLGLESPYHPYPYLEQNSKKAVLRKTFSREIYLDGKYEFRVRALDVLGNVATKTINIDLSGDMKSGLADVFNAPNPVGKKGTTFYFKNLAVGRESTVDIFIYNQHGRLVKVLKDAVSGVTHWDGKDNHGRLLANGLYHYVVRSEVSASGNFKAKTWTKKQKLLISR